MWTRRVCSFIKLSHAPPYASEKGTPLGRASLNLRPSGALKWRVSHSLVTLTGLYIPRVRRGNAVEFDSPTLRLRLIIVRLDAGGKGSSCPFGERYIHELGLLLVFLPLVWT